MLKLNATNVADNWLVIANYTNIILSSMLFVNSKIHENAFKNKILFLEVPIK